MKKLISITLLLAILLNLVLVYPLSQEDYTISNQCFYIGENAVYTLTEGDICASANITNNTENSLKAVILIYFTTDYHLEECKFSPVTIPAGTTVNAKTEAIKISSDFAKTGNLSMTVLADMDNIMPLCKSTLISSTTSSPEPLTEFYDDFSGITLTEEGADISNVTSGNKYIGASALYLESGTNPSAIHKVDNVKQNNFIRGNGWSDTSANAYITYNGNFSGLLLRVETALSYSAEYTLEEYIENYGLYVKTSANGRVWKTVEFTDYDYSNSVLYYHINSANGDKICSYFIEALPDNVKYVRIGFTGDWKKKILNVNFTSDKSGAVPTPTPTSVPTATPEPTATPKPTEEPKDSLFDDYTEVKYTDSSNIVLTDNTDSNIVLVEKGDGNKQNTYAGGNKNSGDYNAYITYEGNFGGQLLGIETTLRDSADYSLKEYADAYDIVIYTSKDGESWTSVEPQGYIYDNFVRYYLYDTANGDKICTYIVNSLPKETQYVKIGFMGDWKKKIFNVNITSDKEYYADKNVKSSLFETEANMYSYTLTDTMTDSETMWSVSGQLWTNVKEHIYYPTNPLVGKDCIIARRDNNYNETQIVYSLVNPGVYNIEVESFYFNSGVSLDEMLEDTGLRFYESSNNKDYTEITNVSLNKEVSTKFQQMHSRVIYNITGLKNTSKYFKIVLPSVERENIWPWSAKIGNVNITYAVEDDSSAQDFSEYDSANYTSHKVSVITPSYTSDIEGDTEIIFCAPGMTSVTARCWKQSNDELGNDSVVATVKVDENGFGSFTFPADEYPHGPIIIRLMGIGGTHLDECHLQLYNKGGVSWMEGTAAYDDPPQAIAAGLKLVYEDDFTEKPTISWNGEGTTYTSHKPSWGDFSGIAFTNDEIWNTGAPNPNSPYSQVDTYLRIRADETKNSTGLICSVALDNEGFKVSYPCYFECKFIAQNAIGAWPSFWLLTETPVDGTVMPGDELDIIEAYGFERTNIDGHTITRIPWNYEDGSKGETKFVSTSYIGNGGQWYTNFHTYGCLIEEDYTTYYYDNIELWSHPTQPGSKAKPFYFLVNYAFGGSSGWPYDLSRYNYVSDMYVDYVRVYGLEENVHYETTIK